MSKAHRGKGIRELFARGRGICPVCGATGIKTLYEQEAGDQKIKVCKPCKAAIKHGKKSLPAFEKPAAEAAPAPAAKAEAAPAPAATPVPAAAEPEVKAEAAPAEPEASAAEPAAE